MSYIMDVDVNARFEILIKKPSLVQNSDVPLLAELSYNRNIAMYVISMISHLSYDSLMELFSCSDSYIKICIADRLIEHSNSMSIEEFVYINDNLYKDTIWQRISYAIHMLATNYVAIAKKIYLDDYIHALKYNLDRLQNDSCTLDEIMFINQLRLEENINFELTYNTK